MRYSVIVLLVIFGLGILTFNSCQKTGLPKNRTETFTIETDSVCFAIIGDYGEAGTPAFNVSELVKSWSPRFILTLGDNNYGDGNLSTIEGNISNYYCDYIYNPDAPDGYQCTGSANDEKQNRFFPSIGNHDYYNDDKILPYLSFFSLPGKEAYYEFKWGSVHFFAINSGEHGEADCCDSEQAVWLQEKLRESDRPFKVVFFHHPPYSSSRHGSTESMQWPFEEWGASAVFSGHEHNYQKITFKDDPTFPYVVNGLGGRSSFYECDKTPLDPELFDSFCFNQNYGAIQATATQEQLSIKFYAIDDTQTPIDEFVISR